MTTTEMSKTESRMAEYLADQALDKGEANSLSARANEDLFDLIEFTETHSLFELYDALGSLPDLTDKELALYEAARSMFRLQVILSRKSLGLSKAS